MTEVGSIMRRVGWVAAALAVVVWLGSGCSDRNGGAGGPASIVGSWEIDDIRNPEYRPQYVHIQADGTWFLSTKRDGTERGGIFTYTLTDGVLVGSFTNSGIGEGRMEATATGNTISIKFVEYWHTPPEAVPYVGVRL